MQHARFYMRYTQLCANLTCQIPWRSQLLLSLLADLCGSVRKVFGSYGVRSHRYGVFAHPATRLRARAASRGDRRKIEGPQAL